LSIHQIKLFSLELLVKHKREKLTLKLEEEFLMLTVTALREEQTHIVELVHSLDSLAQQKRELLFHQIFRTCSLFVEQAKDSITVPRTGSGSIFGFVGASESKSNVEVNTTLFKVTGTPIVKVTLSNVAVGQIRVGLSNPGIPGDLSRGITVFRLRTFPQGPVFKFSGTKAESFTPAPHIAQGLIDILPANTKSRYVKFERPQPTRIVVI